MRAVPLTLSVSPLPGTMNINPTRGFCSTLRKVSARRFPCLGLARAALVEGGAQTCALNAADEVAVAAFLDRRLAFPGIARVIERVLETMPRVRFGTIDDVLAADAEARRLAENEVMRHAEKTAVAR